MNKKLHLVKEKLPKRRRKKNDDDDNLFLKGMYDSKAILGINSVNPYSDYLQTEGYEVDDTANKKIQVDFPEIKGVEWLFDSKVKDYKSLLENRRDKMTQTFRYMLRQNETPYSSFPPSSKKSSSSSSSDGRPSTTQQVLSDLATVARIGGKAVYYTGRAVGQGISTAYDTYNWLNEDESEEEIQQPISEQTFNRTQRIMRRGASRSRSPEVERGRARERSRSRDDEDVIEGASSSNQAIRLIRRNASRSRSNTPDKKTK